MRRVLPVLMLAVLAVALLVGCSRQRQYHVGEWEIGIPAPYKGSPSSHFYITWRFLLDGTCQRRGGFDPRNLNEVSDGTYRIDYSKNPIHIDISLKPDNRPIRGIIKFVGEDKGQMQMRLASLGQDRPADFGGLGIYLFTKKVMK